MFGFEYASGLVQFFIILLLIISLALAIWLFFRLRQSEALLTSIRRDNGKLRNEIANITGWTADGRLPEDWQEKLRSGRAAAGAAASSGAGEPKDLFLMAGHEALASIEPPYFLSNDSADDITRAHQRNVDLMDGLAAERIDPLPALANGDLDKLLCYWRRLEAYFPDRAETHAYGLAAYALLGLLKHKSVQVSVPRPLSVANSNNCVFTTEDREKLRDIVRIRTAAFATNARIANLQGGEELVVDCERPGWVGPNGHANPRILILDRSW